MAGLLAHSSRKNEKSRSHVPKKDREKRPDLNINDYDSHLERLKTFGKSKYRGTMFYVGPKGGVFYITYRGTKVYCWWKSQFGQVNIAMTKGANF